MFCKHEWSVWRFCSKFDGCDWETAFRLVCSNCHKTKTVREYTSTEPTNEQFIAYFNGKGWSYE